MRGLTATRTTAFGSVALLLLFIVTSIVRHHADDQASALRLELSHVQRRLSAFGLGGHGTSRHGCPGLPASLRQPERQTEQSPLVVVTGGAGFIGSAVVRSLLDLSYRVRVLDNMSTGRASNLPQHARLEVLVGDILNGTATTLAMSGAHLVVHLAAFSRVAPSLEGPDAAVECVRSNVDGTLRVLEAARQAGVKRLLYAGSSTAYGGDDYSDDAEDTDTHDGAAAHAFQAAYGMRAAGPMLPSWELDLPQPRSPYAASKYAGEVLVQSYDATFGIPTVILRLFMCYGPREPQSGPHATVVGALLADAAAGRPLRIQGDGTQTRDFVHVDDVARAFVLALQAEDLPRGAVINIGTGVATSITALADLISPDSARTHVPRRRMDIEGTLANTCAAEALLGWRATIGLADGVHSLRTR